MKDSMIIDIYNKIGFNPIEDIIYAESFKPAPNQRDYDFGMFMRYFVQKINQSFVQEVSPENFQQLSNSFYKKTSLQWKISGPQKSKLSGTNIGFIGVEDFNRESIEKSSENLDGLRKVVKNYLEYWRGY